MKLYKLDELLNVLIKVTFFIGLVGAVWLLFAYATFVTGFFL